MACIAAAQQFGSSDRTLSQWPSSTEPFSARRCHTPSRPAKVLPTSAWMLGVGRHLDLGMLRRPSLAHTSRCWLRPSQARGTRTRTLVGPRSSTQHGTSVVRSPSRRLNALSLLGASAGSSYLLAHANARSRSHHSFFADFHQTSEELKRKFTTWGHARHFVSEKRRGFDKNGFENASLATDRIERCSRFCLEPSAKSCQALNVPCDWKQYLSNRVPPCLGRGDNASRPILRTRFCPRQADLASMLQHDSTLLPAPLLEASARTEFSGYFRYTV